MVKIHSTITIKVYPGIKYEERKELVNPAMGTYARVITQNWAGTGVLIKEGLHEYNDEVAKFTSVKDLEEAGKLTIIKNNEVVKKNKKSTASLAELTEDLGGDEDGANK